MAESMRLSAAIRLGAMLRPQAFGGLWVRRHRMLPVGSCALGAAFDALGCGFSDARQVPPPALVAWLDEGGHRCPVCGTLPARHRALMAHLNDEHRWPRAAIADFVETIEPAPAADAVREDVDSPVVSTREKGSSS